ncbi:MAG: PDZ domain-containing protein, partial [Acidobacteriota bacterium]
SGGPLLDAGGRFIGINPAIFRPSGASAGFGFAVPIATAKRLVPQLIRSGEPERVGIGIQPLSDYYAARLGLDGVVIRDVFAGGPAARAGLEGIEMTRRRRVVLGDRIVAANGEPIRNIDDLLYAFEQAGLGATVTLSVVRDDRERQVEVMLARI